MKSMTQARPVPAGDASSTPRRILTYTTLYPSASAPNHGIFVENRLRHLVATGAVESEVVAPVPWFPFRHARFGRYAAMARNPADETRHGIRIEHPRYVVVPKFGMSLTPLTLFWGSRSLIRASAANVDLIDAHYLYPDGVAAVLLARMMRKPVVITARGTDVNLIPHWPLPRRWIRYAAQHADGIVAVSEALKDALAALGVSSERITVLRNGVDLAMFKPRCRAEARRTLGLDGKILLSVGHLIERKGHDIVIRALPRLGDWTLAIAGDGPERPALQQLAAKIGVGDRVRFLGQIPHAELSSLYSAADVLVLASSREGWPNVLLESMACGTPVVATAIWGNPEVVSSPEAGLLVKARTPECISEGVARLYGSLPPREATRRYAERYSWDETSNGQIRLFDEILARRRGSG